MPQDVELVVQVVLAAVLAEALGLERQYRGQPAGLRTYMLVAIASTNFTQVGALGFWSMGQPLSRGVDDTAGC
ncbi:MAG: MgtC/SapB family protein [Chloroflexota bacterium]|nr:MAG: MgtC/SapB family protein [Chloroflexota bacterium]